MKIKVISLFWMVFASALLSLAWVLPNHFLPWLGFHGDAWSASMLLTVAAFVLWRCKFKARWDALPMVFGAVALIPILQFVTGMVTIFGVSWIHSIYLLGFVLAILVGSVWEDSSPGQVADYLFLAIGFATVASIGLQLHQFFRLDGVGPWILYSSGTRHYANMAQPNQFASFLLLGLLSFGWAFHRRVLSSYTAIALSALILFGVALTESRTAWINIVLLVAATFIWHRLSPARGYRWVVLGLAILFVSFTAAIPALNDLFGGGLAIQYRSTTNDPRWGAWILFVRAIAERPLFGFGWGQLGHAQFLLLDEKIAVGGNFLQAHNLMLDLLLWNGVPIGLFIIGFIAYWLWIVVRQVSDFKQLMLLCFLMVLGIHAMLEYPLQYAYFLLPFGLVMGCLNRHLVARFSVKFSQPLTVAVLVLATAALTITIRDYLRVETSFYGLRFEHKKIDVPIPRTPPDVLVLTQWRDYILFARMEPRAGMKREELAWIRNLVTTLPSAFVMYRFAAMLALNDQPDEARTWLRRICSTTPIEHCTIIEAQWALHSQGESAIGAIAWPMPSRLPP